MRSSSNDSSEDENLERFKEAIDVRFINDSMYSDNAKDATEKRDIKEQKQLPSNRPVQEEFVSHHLKVTPEFQSYVSKQLSKLLDNQIKEVTKKKSDCPTEEGDNSTGVYLLRGSKSYLDCKESSDNYTIRKKRKHKRRQIIDDVEQDLTGVVVTPEWVLNQEGTKGWQKNAKKSPLFCYKKTKKGTLELTSETT